MHKLVMSRYTREHAGKPEDEQLYGCVAQKDRSGCFNCGCRMHRVADCPYPNQKKENSMGKPRVWGDRDYKKRAEEAEAKLAALHAAREGEEVIGEAVADTAQTAMHNEWFSDVDLTGINDDVPW